MMVSFIDEHRGRYGVGPLCAEVPDAPSTYYEHKAREGGPDRAPVRERRDGWLCGEIRRVYDVVTLDDGTERTEGEASAGRTAAVLSIVGPGSLFDVATVSTNRHDGSTDTVVYKAR